MDKTTLTCGILHSDAQLIGRLTEYVGKMPFLSLVAVHTHPLEAFNDYLKKRVDLYFVELNAKSKADDIDGIEFCRLLSAETRVVFMAQDERYAARCFQLDALDYLTELNASTFFLTMNKAVRWFSRPDSACPRRAVISCPDAQDVSIIHVRSENRIVRLRLNSLLYVEGMGDYTKIYTRDTGKPVLTLSSMKLMETRLPGEAFIRIHHSFIVNMKQVDYIERSEVVVAGKRLPVGDAYRNRLKQWVEKLMVI